MLTSITDTPVLRRAYPTTEARALLGGIAHSTLYALINSGALRTVKVGGRRLVPADAIEEVLSGRDAL